MKLKKHSINHCLERCYVLFPATFLLGIVAFLICIFKIEPTFILILVLSIYLIPLIFFRIAQVISPSKEGASFIGSEGWSPWLVGFRIQSFFMTFSILEKILRIIPGAFSVWLRLWGSKIGKNVIWSPEVDILDRDSLIVGDNVFFGHKIILLSHVITPKDGKLMLYHKKISIGENSFIGAASEMGPGTKINSNTLVPIKTILKVNEKFNCE